VSLLASHDTSGSGCDNLASSGSVRFTSSEAIRMPANAD
jgi:hypothetical protein